MKKSVAVLVGFLGLIAGGVAYSESKARTYQECILEVTRDGFLQSRRDIGRIKLLCEERFPDTAPDIIGDKLNSEALEKIDIYTNRTDKGYINGSVYNGNPHLILTRLEILLTPKTRQDPVMDFFDSEEYRLNLKVKPFSTESFTIEPEKTGIDGQFSWKLIRAWGY
jgi:hypothetical protein